MRKGILGAMGWLLVALLLLPVGAMAQTAKEKVRITAGVFDSYDNTFVRDEYGVPQNRRTHEKGGELWVKVKGSETFVPAASFNQEVEVGTELTFKVKLAKDAKGDWGEMANFGETSDWWGVREWRVNGEVQKDEDGNELTYIAKAGTKSVHVGVRFQRKQFLVKVVYVRKVGLGVDYSADGKEYKILTNDSYRDLNRSSKLKFKAKAYDVVDFSLNGKSYGSFVNGSDLGSYDMSQGDLWVEVCFSDFAGSRRYIQTLCRGDGEKERFQINTLPLVGTSTDKSHYPIAGVATGKEAKVRPLGIQPRDLCHALDKYVILAKPKRGSRLAYITIDNAVVHDTTFSIPDNEPRTVVGYFVKDGKQILMLSEVGKGAHIKVVRGNTELQAGAEVLPGDRLKVDVTDRAVVASLRINGRRFAPGDEWLVQGSGDVLVELTTKEKNKLYKELYRVPSLQCEVIGSGRIKAEGFQGQKSKGEFTNGQLLYADTVWDKKPLLCDSIKLTPIPDGVGYKCVKFEVNGKKVKANDTTWTVVEGQDVYVRAIFVKQDAKPALVVHTEGATGYVDVIDVATGQRLEEGTILKEGQRLKIQARGSTSEKSRVTEISVNGRAFTANGASNWAKEVTVNANDAKKDAFQVGATFEKATVQPPTPGTQPVLHIVRGKGVPKDKDFIVDVCGPKGRLGDVYPIRDGERDMQKESGGCIAVGIPNNKGLIIPANNYDWIQADNSKNILGDYEVTVVIRASSGAVKVPVAGSSPNPKGAAYWGPGIDWKEDVYVYIRKKEGVSVSATMKQYLDGKTGLDYGDELLVKYDQVSPVSWKKDGDSWKGLVPKGGVLTFEANRDRLLDYKLVSVTINDSLVAGEAGKVVPRGVKLGEWKVPEDAKDGDVRIVTVWRKNDGERVLTYAKIGKGTIDSVMGSGVEIKNGAQLNKTETSLKVCTTPDAGYRLAGIRVNGRFESIAKVGEKVQTVRIPASGDVFVEAVFVKDNTHTLRISVIGEPKPMGEVEVIRGVEQLATGAEVKGEDVLAITARPAVGKRLALLRVNGELFPNGNCYIVPSGKDVSVEATFVQEDGYALFVEQEGDGEVVVERKSAAQGVWSEIYSGDAIYSTDEIRVKATAATDYKLEALFVNQRNQHGAESGKYTEGMAVGQGNIYVRAIFKEASDTQCRVYIVTTPGGYVKVATPDGRELRDGDAIDASSVKALTVSSYAFPGNRAVLLQVNWVNHKSGESYSVPKEGNVFVEARFVPTHRIALAIEVQNSALGGDVVVTDVETGARLDNGALLQEGQTIRVEVTGIGQAAELPVPEVSGPAHRQSSGANTWVVEGSDGVVCVRAAFAKEYYTVEFERGQVAAGATVEGTMDAQRVPVGIKTKLHLNQFTAEGYRFDGWKDKKGQTYTDGEAVSDLAGKDGTAELTAQWKAIYKVTFMLNGGEMYLPENPMAVDEGTSLNKIDYTPHKDGYAFVNWHTDASLLPNSNVDWPYVVGKSDTLYAEWKLDPGKTTCKVTFDLNGGSYLGSPNNVVNSVVKGTSVVELKPAPTKKEYLFEGWYQERQTDPYDFSRQVKADITLVAQWKKIEEYTVTFDANGGRPSVESQRVKKEGYASMPVVTRDGWELRGWYDGGKKYEFSEKVKGDIALKAEWSPKVTFSEGVKVTDENARELSSGDTVRCGSSISVCVHAPQGKRIKSVTIGGTVEMVNEPTYSKNDLKVDAPTTIYVEWEEWKEYTVTVATGIAHGKVTVPVTQAAAGVEVAVTATADAGYKLEKLTYTYTDAAGVRHEEDITGEKEFTMPAAAVEVSAEFVPATATATFVVKDADGNPVEGASVKVEGVNDAQTTDANGAAKFEGLTVDKEYSYTVHKDTYQDVPGSVKLPAEGLTVVVTLYQNGATLPTQYTVTFNAAGGTFTNGNGYRKVQVEKDQSIPSDKVEKPIRAGYTCTGWLLDGADYDLDTQVTKDITLVAKWMESGKVEFIVTFDSKGGTAVAPQKVEEGKSATKPAEPKKDGYKFVEWQLKGVKYDFSKKVTESITLVAEWKRAVGVTITVVDGPNNGVEGATVTIVDENGEYKTDPTKTGQDGKVVVPGVPAPTEGTVTVEAKINGEEKVVTVPVKVDEDGNADPNTVDFKSAKEVELKVVDAVTGKGIKDAMVKVGTQEAKTKDEGKVTLNLMVGKKGYPVLAKAEGYADGEVVLSVNDKGIADPDTIWLTVVKDVKIRVTNGTDPVKDATVTIVDGNGDPHEATTDAEGNTTVPDVPAPTDGTITVKVGKKVVTVPVTVDENGKADPSEIDFKSAKPVELTVVDAVTPNDGIKGATVTVGAQTATTGTDGKVTLNLLGGKSGYPVLAKATGYADGKVKVSVDTDGKAKPNEIKLMRKKNVTIKVTKGADPVKDATVTIVDGNGAPYTKKTDGDGNATVEDVPVPIEKNGTVTVEKGEKVVTVPVTVDKDGKAKPNEIDLDDKNIKEVKLTVVDAKTKQKIKGATVTVGAQHADTDGDGEVLLSLMVGDGYPVLATATGYAEDKVIVSVDADGKATPGTIELTPLAAPYLNVFLVDQDLKPIDGVVVKIFSGTDSITQDTTKSEGWVKMQLTAGKYRIAVAKEGYNKPEPVEVTLEAHGLDFTFVLQKKDQNNGNTTPVESELLAGVEMYPNPASVATVLRGVENARRVAVYALTGVQVLSQAVHGEEETNLQVESLTEGVYIVVVEAANGERKALKLVVRR